MLYREIIAVCSQIHTKHINTLCGQNVELLTVKLAVHIVTTGLQSVSKIEEIEIVSDVFWFFFQKGAHCCIAPPPNPLFPYI